jgi:hypothetical protein
MLYDLFLSIEFSSNFTLSGIDMFHLIFSSNISINILKWNLYDK